MNSSLHIDMVAHGGTGKSTIAKKTLRILEKKGIKVAARRSLKEKSRVSIYFCSPVYLLKILLACWQITRYYEKRRIRILRFFKCLKESFSSLLLVRKKKCDVVLLDQGLLKNIVVNFKPVTSENELKVLKKLLNMLFRKEKMIVVFLELDSKERLERIRQRPQVKKKYYKQTDEEILKRFEKRKEKAEKNKAVVTNILKKEFNAKILELDASESPLKNAKKIVGEMEKNL